MDANPDPLFPTDPAWRVCRDCEYPYPADGTCPNPGCRPRMGEENRRKREWLAQRAEWVASRQADAIASGTFYQPGVLEEQYNRLHPFT